MSIDPDLVTVNCATSPSLTSTSLISYMIFGALTSLPTFGTPPANPTDVISNGFPVYASSQTY